MAALLAGCVSTLAARASASADASGPQRAAAGTAATSGASAGSASADFDRNLLPGADQNKTDLTRFQHANPVSPGNYNADIYFNGAWVGRSNVRLVAMAPGSSASPCVDRDLLDQLNFHPDHVSAEVLAQLVDPTACVNFGSLIPAATLVFDIASLRLDATIPQAYLKQQPRGYVNPQFWDAGVPAALLNYNFNAYHTSSVAQNQTTGYLGLTAGINIGMWHFRQNSSLSWQSATAQVQARSQWQDIDTYAQRELPSLHALLTLADSYTDGQVFDSYALRGIQLSTDDRMLPQSLQGYAPVVRGVAQTNAVVTVRQNGILLYQTTVAPGPFEINDLYPTGYGGHLDVAVTEADGHVRTSSVSYTPVAQLLRAGTSRFNVAAGLLRDTSLVHRPGVAQAALQHGFSNLLTGYAGIAGSVGYAAALAGAALNTRFGGIAFDVIEARAQIPGLATQLGHSLRLSYSKILLESNTSLTVAAYRHSSSGYLSLPDAALARDYARRGLNAFSFVPPPSVLTPEGLPVPGLLTVSQQAALSGRAFNGALSGALTGTGLQRQRNSISVSISQRLGPHGGSFYLNGSADDYWNRSGTRSLFAVGYNNAFHRASYSISAVRTLDVLGRYDNQYQLSVTLQLGEGAHTPTLSLNSDYDDSGGSQQQAMLNGTAGSNNQFSYATGATHGSNGAGNAGSINAGYRSPYAVLNTSFGSGSSYSQASLSASGTIVAHPGGVTFGQPAGDTVGVVYVPDAAGARLANAAGARIDHFGYALVPYLTPYTLNTVQIDPKGLPLDVQLNATSAQVAPYSGAVVMLTFKTERGRSVIFRVRLASGKPLPFGAEVLNAKNITLGVTGQTGQLLLRGVEQAGQLTARWVDDDGLPQSCQISYALGPRGGGKRSQAYEEIQTTCLTRDGVKQAGSDGA